MSVGPFYCVYLRPKWRMLAKPAESEEETLDHPAFWRILCKNIVAPHYGVQDKRTLSILSDLCYAMPRGRCAQALPRRGAPTQEWTIYHGGDFPDAGAIKNASTEIYSIFNLADQSQVHFRFDEHERMQSDDQQLLQRILGPVPYSSQHLI